MAAAMASMTRMEQAEYLQNLAYQEPPLRLKGLALVTVCLTVVFIFLTSILSLLRIYVRGFMKGRTRGFGWEDLWGILAWVSMISW